jgi:hypothetical protein
MYTGMETVYSTGNEYCVEMSEIGAVYSVADGTASLDEAWTISGVYVLSDVLPLGNTRLETINQLTAMLGSPIYLGSTWVNLPEAVALNMLLSGGSETDLPPVEIESSSTFDEVREVSRYDTDYELYIYVYEQDGLLYTFYCDGSATTGFLMYSIEQA